ncbi:hypothetical protein GCM10023081_32940 [Arthrobacter ginkgonis]|uniref:Large ribosomal subunit protein bL25 L25 domain-containing protein n=1 Tax=Arthrobacter ginkgonis TaxID=1630594 RepID=A0ABP7CQJ2_9MICC
MSTKIAAELRSDFGKGAARQARRDEKIPAVIYGQGSEPVHVLLPARETTLILRGKAAAELVLDIEGTERKVVVKDIQRDPLKQIIEHLDLLLAA